MGLHEDKQKGEHRDECAKEALALFSLGSPVRLLDKTGSKQKQCTDLIDLKQYRSDT